MTAKSDTTDPDYPVVEGDKSPGRDRFGFSEFDSASDAEDEGSEASAIKDQDFEDTVIGDEQDNESDSEEESEDVASPTLRHREPRPSDVGESPSDYQALGEFVQDRNGSTGTLTVTVGWESISVPAHSGGIDAPAIPPGTYELLQGVSDPSPYFFRLEAVDGKYGNDEVDGTSSPSTGDFSDIKHLRLHVPGQSLGCIAVGSHNGDYSRSAYGQWRSVARLLAKASTSTRSVQRMAIDGWTLGGIFGTEPQQKLGVLRVRKKAAE